MSAGDLELRIARLELEPGDVLVAKSSVRLTYESMAANARVLEYFAPPGVKVLMLPPEVDLSVLTRAQIDALPPTQPPTAEVAT